MSGNGQIITAMAEFTGAINQLKQLTKGDKIAADEWLTVLYLELFSKMLPKEVREKINLSLGSMDTPDVSKLLEILEQQRGTMLMSGTSGFETPSKRKGNAAAAATAMGKQASSGKGKKKPACTYDGCNSEHFLYKCP